MSEKYTAIVLSAGRGSHMKSRVPKQDMGRLAVREIVDMIQGKNTTKTKIQICTEFMERDSVRDLNDTKDAREI